MIKLLTNRNAILLFSIGLFVISLTQPCYCTETSCGYSAFVLITGALGFILSGAALVWLANPFLLVSWFYIRRAPKLSLRFSLIAFSIALSFLFFKQVMLNEAGDYGKIINYQLGYWLWLSSSFIMLLGNLALKYLVKFIPVSPDL
jgi:hypothetical protein